MSRYSNEEKQASIRRARELPEELDARTPYEPAAEGANMHTFELSSIEDRNDHLIRYGIKLADPHGLERWRAEAETQERAFEQEREARAERDRQIMRERQREQRSEIDDAVAELARDVNTAVGETVAILRNEFAEQLGKLRDELNMQRAHASKFGEVLDLPALPLRRKSDAA